MAIESSKRAILIFATEANVFVSSSSSQFPTAAILVLYRFTMSSAYPFTLSTGLNGKTSLPLVLQRHCMHHCYEATAFLLLLLHFIYSVDQVPSPRSRRSYQAVNSLKKYTGVALVRYVPFLGTCKYIIWVTLPELLLIVRDLIGHFLALR